MFKENKSQNNTKPFGISAIILKIFHFFFFYWVFLETPQIWRFRHWNKNLLEQISNYFRSPKPNFKK